jgi:hypothetical protein
MNDYSNLQGLLASFEDADSSTVSQQASSALQALQLATLWSELVPEVHRCDCIKINK